MIIIMIVIILSKLMIAASTNWTQTILHKKARSFIYNVYLYGAVLPQTEIDNNNNE